MKLTRTERWILSNQFAILAALYPDETEMYKEMRQVVDHGYEMSYEWISTHISDDKDTMSEAECLEVLDILGMFTAIKDTYNRLQDTSGINDLWIKFIGFDGNNEGKFLGYTHFLVEVQGKFPEIDHINSHAPMLPGYRQMLAEWKQSKDRQNLTKDDLIRITSK